MVKNIIIGIVVGLICYYIIGLLVAVVMRKFFNASKTDSVMNGLLWPGVLIEQICKLPVLGIQCVIDKLDEHE